MAEEASPLPRRLVAVAAYTLGTGLLLRVVSEDLTWFANGLASLGTAFPERLVPGDDATAGAIVLVSVLAGVLALGMFLVSRRTGTGLGLLVAGTLAWTLFAYAEIPWAGVAPDAAGTRQPPASVWMLSAGLVLLATLEIATSARDEVHARIHELGLASSVCTSVRRQIWSAHRRWLLLSAGLGLAAVVAFAQLGSLAERFIVDPDLVSAPALAGIVAGLALWWWARRSG